MIVATSASLGNGNATDKLHMERQSVQFPHFPEESGTRLTSLWVDKAASKVIYLFKQSHQPVQLHQIEIVQTAHVFKFLK